MLKLLAAMLAAFLCSTSLPAVAATTGLVRGTILVNDKAQAGVNVVLSGEGATLRTHTDAAGAYVFSQVSFGDYALSASYPGVAEKRLNITVASDQVLTVNFTLGGLRTIASLNTTARVTASGTPVAVNALTRQQISELPTNNSLNQLISTVPGIVRFSYNEPVAHGFHGVTYEIDGAPMPQATSSNFSEIIDPKSIDSLEIFSPTERRAGLVIVRRQPRHLRSRHRPVQARRPHSEHALVL